MVLQKTNDGTDRRYTGVLYLHPVHKKYITIIYPDYEHFDYSRETSQTKSIYLFSLQGIFNIEHLI
jgi:hypothetical protein